MDYPSNSHKAKDESEPREEKKKVEKVITGEVVRRKKPLGKRLTETFVRGDARSAWGYVMFDVLIPAAKDMVADAVSQGAERMLYGETRSTRSRTGSRPSGVGGYQSYNRYSSASPLDKDRDDRSRSISRRGRATHDFDEILLATRVEAQEVLNKLGYLIEKYDTTSVADLYDMVDLTSQYTDNQWGWTDLSTAEVSHVRGGYLLDLPKPELLK